MPIGKYFHIYIKRNPAHTLDSVQKEINLARDWYRIQEDMWIVYSTSTEDKWKERLEKFVKPGGFLLIMETNPAVKQGWMPKPFWAWLKKEKK